MVHTPEEENIEEGKLGAGPPIENASGLSPAERTMIWQLFGSPSKPQATSRRSKRKIFPAADATSTH